MSGQWGNYLRVSIYGESHGPAIGITIDGLPSGLPLDLDAIAFEMARRAPGRNSLSTQRQEADTPRILSGLYRGTVSYTHRDVYKRQALAHGMGNGALHKGMVRRDAAEF